MTAPASLVWPPEARDALARHWPEYLIEGAALGLFMLSAGIVTTLLEAPASPLRALLPHDGLRRALIGLAMGATAVMLIYSPWGQRSGAHLNPAVTLAYLRLRRVRPWDAAFYAIAQFAGGTIGALVSSVLLGPAFSDPPVQSVATLPGSAGVTAAFAAEVLIAFVLMIAVLLVSASRHARHTGLVAGALVALYITFEAPLSGMSLNPARSFASSVAAGVWRHYWIYLLAPVLGMQLAALLYTWRRLPRRCAKLFHPDSRPCIHCGETP
jgi:aquaporin Z